MKQYFSVKGWDKFQHYKDRNPPWIKLHNSLLDNIEFECLQDASKAHLLCIWMLASRTNNKMLMDNEWIKRKIGASGKVDLEILLDADFIELQGMGQDASKVLVSVEERRGEAEKSISDLKSEIPTAIKYQKVLDLYHEILTSLPKVKVFSEERKRRIKTILTIDAKFKTEGFWRSYFEHVGTNNFLMGRKETTTHAGWTADFDFLTTKSKFIKIIEGNYDN